MPRKLSPIAPDWWDYTTLENELINDAARLTQRDLQQLSRPGFKVVMYDTLEDFYLAEALEYIERVAPAHRGQSGRHLRSDRTDGAASARGAPRERTRPSLQARALLGHGRVV